MTANVRDFFVRQAAYCDRLGSPFTAFACRVLAERLDTSSAFGARLLSWPGDAEADAAPLRACGALNHLAREGFAALTPLYPPHASPDADAYWRGVEAAIAAHDARLTAFLDSPPQTNEIGRSAALLFGHAEIAKRTGLPLALLETGASAGLNLQFDRYAFDFGAFQWGNPESPVKIRCAWRGPAIDLPQTLAVSDRRGCDLKPIDAADAKARARMLAYIWPDQVERLARAEAALAMAARDGLRIEPIDAEAFLARELSLGMPGQTRVLVHTSFWLYLSASSKAAVQAMIAQKAAAATPAEPFAWLRIEGEAGETRGNIMRLSLWPHGPVDAALALVDFHGRWVEWRGMEEG